MQVFKLCLKILQKNIPSMLIYVIIFTAITIMMSTNTAKEQSDLLFTDSKINLAFIAEEDTPLVRGLKGELAKRANFVQLPDEKEALQDALYFRKVSYILRIPKGFSANFMAGDNVQLEKTVVPNSFSNAYLDLSIEQYLNSARLYVEQLNLPQEELVQYLEKDLARTAIVELAKGAQPAKRIFANHFFNFLAYTLLATLIQGMSSLMLIFHNLDLKQRNACSPLSTAAFNKQLFLSVLFFTVAAWAIMVTICLLFTLRDGFNLNTAYFLLNSFVFAVCGATISYLIGLVVKNATVIPAVCNVITLGLSFVSGVFVPMELLGDSVLKIASFTPTYWYVAANNHLASLTQFNLTTLQPFFYSLFIQLGFALAFFTMALVLGKSRKLA
ncbi:MAG: ABC transporter permease [Firmicutes bacterium]|nr:ABC transporter permease [Bacillota bacterium]